MTSQPASNQHPARLDPIPSHEENQPPEILLRYRNTVKMSSKQKRPIGDANEEMGSNKRAKRDLERPAENNTPSLGASQREPKPITSPASAAKDTWRLGQTRRAIFAKIQSLEGPGAVNAQQNVVRENLARRRVYEDIYAKGCGSSNGAAITVNVEYSVDTRLWTDHGMTFRHLCSLPY